MGRLEQRVQTHFDAVKNVFCYLYQMGILFSVLIFRITTIVSYFFYPTSVVEKSKQNKSWDWTVESNQILVQFSWRALTSPFHYMAGFAVMPKA